MERYIKDNKKLIQSYFNMLNIKQIPINHKWLKSRWGYCNIIKKNIYISDLLYAFTSTQINYVIIHEISHLLVGNHSRQFWNVVATIIPNYKQIRKDLKKGHIILN
jgi:predicted metal-dependent hydrolase